MKKKILIISQLRSNLTKEKNNLLYLNEGCVLYQRNHLPDFCHHCGSVDYIYSKLRCLCGVEVFSDEDSMAFVLVKH
jgi:hypothetical protein